MYRTMRGHCVERATIEWRKCSDIIYFTSLKNITREFIACGRQLLQHRWPGNVQAKRFVGVSRLPRIIQLRYPLAQTLSLSLPLPSLSLLRGEIEIFRCILHIFRLYIFCIYISFSFPSFGITPSPPRDKRYLFECLEC